MNRQLPRRRSAAACPEIGSTPTPERLRHGAVEELACPIADEAGHPARPFRAVDTLSLMQRRGSITAGMREAAEDFRTRFAAAQLDPLRALDYSRPRDHGSGRTGGGNGLGLRVEGAREHVWRAIVAVGGPRSPGGSCLWHVVGWERSIKQWALEQGWNGRRISQEAASGILVAALGALEAHYQRMKLQQKAKLRKSDFGIDKSGSIC